MTTDFFDLFKVSKQSCKTKSFMCRLKHKRVDLKPTEEKFKTLLGVKKLQLIRIRFYLWL